MKVARVIIIIVPDPLPCSGYVRFGASVAYTQPCTCCYCWVTQYNDEPLLSDTRFIHDQKITRYNVAFIPATRRYLYEKYYMEIEQMSVY